MPHPSPTVSVPSGRHRLPERVVEGADEQTDRGSGRRLPTVLAPTAGQQPRHLRPAAEEPDVSLLRRVLDGLHAQL